MQAIVRFSLDRDRSSALRNKIAPMLTKAGFQQHGKTGSWITNNSLSSSDLATISHDFWSIAAKHKGTGTVDHFWMYADKDALDEWAKLIG